MRSFALLAVLCASGLVADAAVLELTATSSTGPTTVDMAMDALRGGDYTTAADRFEELLDRSPEWADGWLYLARARFMVGDPSAARRAVDQALTVKPDAHVYDTYWDAGRLLNRASRFRESLVPLAAAAELAPAAERRQVQEALASSQFRAGEYGAARSTLEQGLEESGVSESRAWLLALTCQRLKDYECALARLDDVVQLDGSRRARALRYLAEWSAFAARDTALRRAGEWYRDQPQEPAALELYAKQMLAAGHAVRLVDELSAATAGNDCLARLWTARAWNAADRHTEAEQAALAALTCDPSSALAAVEAAFAQVGQLEPEHEELAAVREDQLVARRALDSLERARQIDPEVYERNRELAQGLHTTMVSLNAVAAELIAADESYRQALADADRDELRQRCLNLLWIRRNAPEALSAEDRAFFDTEDCRRFATGPGGSPR